MPLTSAVVIPTKDRPQELRNCLTSLLGQTRFAEQIIVVDDGQEDEADLRAHMTGYPGPFLYHRKTGEPGAARSRNLGVALTAADVVFFLDDDVVLEPEYVAETMALYEGEGGEQIGGVGGVITNFHLGWSERLYDLIRGRWWWGHGRVFPSGLNQCNYEAVRKVQAVEWLGGGVCSFRRRVLEEFPFTEAFGGYSLAEDVKHSYRAIREYQLLITPLARLAHYKRSKGSLDPEGLAYKQILNFWYHFERNMPHRLGNRAAFAWMIVATVLGDAAGLALQPHRARTMLARLRGHLRGVRACRRSISQALAGAGGGGEG